MANVESPTTIQKKKCTYVRACVCLIKTYYIYQYQLIIAQKQQVILTQKYHSQDIIYDRKITLEILFMIDLTLSRHHFMTDK